MFVGEANEENIVFFRRFIKILELIYGLLVNRNKCSLFGVNVDETWVE